MDHLLKNEAFINDDKRKREGSRLKLLNIKRQPKPKTRLLHSPPIACSIMANL